MAEASESGLLLAWRAGSGEAFAELVRRHQSALLRLARALLGERAAHEDVVQEAFLRLAKSPPDLPQEVLGRPDEERAQLSAWLHRVTRNLCMDVMRSETRRREHERDAASPEAADGGLVAIEAEDTRAMVAAKLGKLPDDQRDVLVLRLLADKSYSEIAAITGKKIGTVGWLISVGLKALSAELAPLVAPSVPLRASTGRGMGTVRGEWS
jgi:RNA polymerase sigma-70 factor (ECF subfamily)